MALVSTSSPLVERAVARLRGTLQGGRYESGRPLPSHRAWARELGVSTFTIHRAMEVLKAEGLVESEEGSYTFLRGGLNFGGSEAESVRTTVKLWVSGRRDFRKLRQAIGRHRFQSAFLKRHPGAVLKEMVATSTWEAYEAELVDLLVRGAGPTLGSTKMTWLPFLADHGALATWEGSPALEAFFAGMDPQVAPLCRVPTAPSGIFMVPTTVSRLGFLLNREDFARAGLDPEKGLGDWESFHDTARQLSRSMNGAPALHLRGWGEAIWWLMQLAVQAGGHAGAATDWEGTAMREAIEFFLAMEREGCVRVHEDDPALFPAKCLGGGMPICLDSIASEILHLGEAERFALVPPPAGAKGRAASLMNVTGWFLNAHASEGEKKLAAEYALEYERWLHEGEGGRQMEDLGVTAPVWSLRRQPQADRYLAQKMPVAWRAGLERICGDAVVESPGADVDKLVLAPVLREILHSTEKSDPAFFQDQLRLAHQQFGLPGVGSEAPAI
jgi:DNA-binding FadR family transcriptional regulator